MGLPDLASDVSPLFAEPMFLFGWALCNTSTYCKLTFWLSCVNYALRGEFPLLHRLLQDIFTYALFWLPRDNLSLKNKLPFYTISFSWNKRLLEPKFLCDECSVNLYNFFAKVTTLSLKLNENTFSSYQIHRHCIVVHRKGLVKLSSPPLHSLLTRRKRKASKKWNWYIVNSANNYLAGFLRTYRTKIAVFWLRKKTKSRRQNEPENLPRKEQGNEK